MERDFMSLSVKQETTDEVIDAAPLRSSAMHWSFSNDASAVPRFLSFGGAQDENPKVGFESLASSGLITITTSESIDSDHRSYSGVVVQGIQKNVVSKKQTGPHYSTMTRPVACQTSLTIGAGGHNRIGPIVPQPLPALPEPTSGNAVVGMTDSRNASKISVSPADQLTIFYNGAVCVYDNISPEKAQAIMLLAGNGPTMNSTATIKASSILDGFIVPQPYGTTISRSGPTSAWSGSINAISGSNRSTEPRKVVNSPGLVSATYVSSGAVPQFRKKSLARFLEKRKERVISESPYANKQSPHGNINTPGAGSSKLSPMSSGSLHVSTVN